MGKTLDLEIILWDDSYKITKLKVNRNQKLFVISNADSLIEK